MLEFQQTESAQVNFGISEYPGFIYMPTYATIDDMVTQFGRKTIDTWASIDDDESGRSIEQTQYKALNDAYFEIIGILGKVPPKSRDLAKVEAVLAGLDLLDKRPLARGIGESYPYKPIREWVYNRLRRMRRGTYGRPQTNIPSSVESDDVDVTVPDPLNPGDVNLGLY